MTITEKAAYLKGLAEGLDLDKDSKEGKLFAAIIDLLDEMAEEVTSLDEDIVELAEGLDAVSEDLEDVEEIIFGDDYDEYDECDDDECDCCGHHHDNDDGDFEVSVQCPACDTEFVVDEDALADGEIECPNCGELLEFEFDGYEDEDAEEENKD